MKNSRKAITGKDLYPLKNAAKYQSPGEFWRRAAMWGGGVFFKTPLPVLYYFYFQLLNLWNFAAFSQIFAIIA